MDFIHKLIAEAVTLFAIINPLGNLPVFESLLIDTSPELKRKTYLNAIIYSVITLLIFTFLGVSLLENIFHISIYEFKFAGGIILMVLGTKSLLFPEKKEMLEKQFSMTQLMEMAVTPIACPLLIGPGAILTSILNYQRNGFFIAFTSIILVFVFVYIIFFYSSRIMKIMGKFGSILISRIMQIIIISVGVHFVVTASKVLWK